VRHGERSRDRVAHVSAKISRFAHREARNGQSVLTLNTMPGGLIDDPNSPKTRLLTLLNESASKSKRRRIHDDDGELPAETSRRMNMRAAKKYISFSQDDMIHETSPMPDGDKGGEEGDVNLEESEDEEEADESADEDVANSDGVYTLDCAISLA
jgi:hypothetical protein